MVISKHLQANSQSSNHLGQPPTREETSALNIEKTFLVSHFIISKTYLSQNFITTHVYQLHHHQN